MIRGTGVGDTSAPTPLREQIPTLPVMLCHLCVPPPPKLLNAFGRRWCPGGGRLLVARALRILGLHKVHEAMTFALHVVLVGDMACKEDCRARLVNGQTDAGNAPPTD